MVNTLETASVKDSALEFTDRIMPCVLNVRAIDTLNADEIKLVSALVAVAVKVYMRDTYAVCTLNNVDYALTKDINVMIKVLQRNKTQIVSNSIMTVLPSVLNSSSAIQMFKYSSIETNVQNHSAVRQKLFTVLVYSMWFYVHEYACGYIAERLRKLCTMYYFVQQDWHTFADIYSRNFQGNCVAATANLKTKDLYNDFDCAIVLQSVEKNVEGIKLQTYIVAQNELTEFFHIRYMDGRLSFVDHFSFRGVCVCGLLYIPMSSEVCEQALLNAERIVVITVCTDCINTRNMSDLVFLGSHLWLSARDAQIAYTSSVYQTIVTHGGFSIVACTKVKREEVILQYITSNSNLAVARLYITPKALKLCKNLMRKVNTESIHYSEKSVSFSTRVVHKSESSYIGDSAQCHKTVMYNGVELPVASQDIGFNSQMQLRQPKM